MFRLDVWVDSENVFASFFENLTLFLYIHYPKLFYNIHHSKQCLDTEVFRRFGPKNLFQRSHFWSLTVIIIRVPSPHHTCKFPSQTDPKTKLSRWAKVKQFGHLIPVVEHPVRRTKNQANRQYLSLLVKGIRPPCLKALLHFCSASGISVLSFL